MLIEADGTPFAFRSDDGSRTFRSFLEIKRLRDGTTLAQLGGSHWRIVRPDGTLFEFEGRKVFASIRTDADSESDGLSFALGTNEWIELGKDGSVVRREPENRQKEDFDPACLSEL